jgi:hypothetical protein
VKGECLAAVASEKERRGKTRWSRADNDAIVQIVFPPSSVCMQPTVQEASRSRNNVEAESWFDTSRRFVW